VSPTDGILTLFEVVMEPITVQLFNKFHSLQRHKGPCDSSQDKISNFFLLLWDLVIVFSGPPKPGVCQKW